MIKKQVGIKNLIKPLRDNDGSVMVTVLIAFFFVSILVAVILSTVSVNMRMRGIDRKTKDEFYYAENALNDVYNGIGKECSVIMGEAYNEVLTDYKGDSGSLEGKKEEDAYNAFVEKFIRKFHARVYKSNKPDMLNNLNGYTVKNNTAKNASRATVKNVGNVHYYSDAQKRVNTTEILSSDFDSEVSPTDSTKKIRNVRCIVIENVDVISNEAAGENMDYVSEITADIVIEVPRVSFFTINKDIYEYGILSNDGIEFRPGSTGILSGNVYAGTMAYRNIGDDTKLAISENTETYEYGGIYINGATVTMNDAEYIVSGGDIYIDGDNGSGNGSGTGKLYINYDMRNVNDPDDDEARTAQTQVWFENLKVKGKQSTVRINGDLFAANDLEVNGNGSDVVISGGYYGYNDGTMKMGSSSFITTKEAKLNWAKDIKRSGYNNYFSSLRSGDSWDNQDSARQDKSAMSSSIIFNAQDNAKLDMTGLNTLLLEGTAYINHETKAGANVLSDGTINNIKDDNIEESVALKSSQTIFLVPGDFIEGMTNPTVVNGTGNPFQDKVEISSTWFAKDYLQTGANNDYKYIILKEGSRNYAYCYLNFKDGGQMSYLDDISKAQSTDPNPGASPTAYEVKRDIEKLSKLYESSVKIGHDSTTPGYAGAEPTRIYSKGSIVEYNKDAGVNGTISVKGTSDFSSAKIYHNNRENLYKRYRILDTFAEPLEYKPFSDSISDVDDDDLFNTVDQELPLDRFFWIAGTNNGLDPYSPVTPTNPTGSSGIWCSEKIAGSRLVLIRSGYDHPFELYEDMEVLDADGNSVKLFNSTNCNLFVIADSLNGLLIKKNPTTGQSHVKINGFLASKGKIIVDKDVTLDVTYDTTLINRRVNEEQKKLAEVTTGSDDDVFDDLHHYEAYNGSPAGINISFKSYLIYYLLDSGRFDKINPYTIYSDKLGRELKNKSAATAVTNYRMIRNRSGSNGSMTKINTDYTSFVYYENWKKGQQ